MSAHPILVSAAETDPSLLRLMEDAQVHHLPIVENGLLLGVWVATDDGRIVMLGRDRVAEISSDSDADAGMRALIGDAEAVLVRDAELRWASSRAPTCSASSDRPGAGRRPAPSAAR